MYENLKRNILIKVIHSNKHYFTEGIVLPHLTTESQLRLVTKSGLVVVNTSSIKEIRFVRHLTDKEIDMMQNIHLFERSLEENQRAHERLMKQVKANEVENADLKAIQTEQITLLTNLLAEEPKEEPIKEPLNTLNMSEVRMGLTHEGYQSLKMLMDMNILTVDSQDNIHFLGKGELGDFPIDKAEFIEFLNKQAPPLLGFIDKMKGLAPILSFTTGDKKESASEINLTNVVTSFMNHFIKGEAPTSKSKPDIDSDFTIQDAILTFIQSMNKK